MMAEVKWLILFGVACYGFGALSVTADELYGIAQFYGIGGVYYFPIIGARGAVGRVGLRVHMTRNWLLLVCTFGLDASADKTDQKRSLGSDTKLEKMPVQSLGARPK
jgi:hypothetical protein